MIGIGSRLTVPLSHTTGHTDHIAAGSMNNGSSHAASSGSLMFRKARSRNANVNAGVLLIRHGAYADLLVFHASRVTLISVNPRSGRHGA